MTSKLRKHGGKTGGVSIAPLFVQPQRVSFTGNPRRSVKVRWNQVKPER